MRLVGIIIALATGIGAIASVIAFIGNPAEAYFMFAAMLGGICYLCIRRLRDGPSLAGNPLDSARHPNVYLPEEEIEQERQPIFGPNAKPWLIQFAILIALIVFVAPWLRDTFDYPVRAIVHTVSDAACSATDLCTPEAAARRRASKDR